MKCKTAILTILLVWSCTSDAQSWIAFSGGFSADLNNKKPFYAIPVSINWKPGKYSGFFVEGIESFGINRNRIVKAYSANPQLPAEVPVTERVRNQSLSIGMGAIINLYTGKKNDVKLNLSSGFASVGYIVSYKGYDQVHYEVLNPDGTERVSGLYGAISTAYNFTAQQKDLFIMLRFQTAPLATRSRYPYSYHFAVPLQLTFGYQYIYKRK